MELTWFHQVLKPFFKCSINAINTIYIYTEWGGGINSRTDLCFCWQGYLSWTLINRSAWCCWYWTVTLLLFFRLSHPDIPYSTGATSSTNNPEFVEGLSQDQLLQNEPSNTAEGSEQRHEDEVSWSMYCYWSLKLLKKHAIGVHLLAFLHSLEFSVLYVLFI